MKLIKYILLVNIIIILHCYAQSIKNRAENLLEIKFPEKEISFEKFSIPHDIKSKIESETQQRFFRDEVYIWKVSQKDSLVAVVILDNVYGKELPITFMVTFDELGSIVSTEIIKYRSTRGGDVQNRSWLDQFLGFNDESTFQVGNTIDGISGASYSVSSLTKGIYKLTLLANEILMQ